MNTRRNVDTHNKNVNNYELLIETVREIKIRNNVFVFLSGVYPV